LGNSFYGRPLLSLPPNDGAVFTRGETPERVREREKERRRAVKMQGENCETPSYPFSVAIG